MQVVLELFDKAAGFNADDQHIARSAADLGVELMRQALGQRKTNELLFDAVAAALKASEKMTESLTSPPQEVLEQLKVALPTCDAAAESSLHWRRRSAISGAARRAGARALPATRAAGADAA